MPVTERSKTHRGTDQLIFFHGSVKRLRDCVRRSLHICKYIRVTQIQKYVDVATRNINYIVWPIKPGPITTCHSAYQNGCMYVAAEMASVDWGEG